MADMVKYIEALEPGGNLVMSGFFETDIDGLRNQAEKLGLKYEGRYVSNQWAALYFTN